MLSSKVFNVQNIIAKSVLANSVLAIIISFFGNTCLAKEVSELSPEPSSGLYQPSLFHAKHEMIVSANQYISAAGYSILKQGGNAVDAAVAAAIMVTLVEPQSAGIGGGGFILFHDPNHKILTSIDARETTSVNAYPNQFLDNTGKPLSYAEVGIDGKSVGVPGLLKGLELIHQKYGQLPWKQLFKPTIQLALEGFIVSPRLKLLIEKDPFLKNSPSARDYFFDSQLNARPVGYRLKNPALANVLKKIAQSGVATFYEDDIAKDIIEILSHHTVPGNLELADFKNYQAIEREVICGPYKVWKICSMGPPSSGATTLISLLGIFQNLPVNTNNASEFLHYFSEAGRLAYADRDQYVMDPKFGEIPIKQMIDSNYLYQRSQLIQSNKSLIKATPGQLTQKYANLGIDEASELPSTSHISIVDKNGLAISMTISVAAAFGSRIMVDGFMLNNEMTDFSFSPNDHQGPILNRIAPNKRPRSSMAPTFVFDEKHRLKLVLGSAGGPAIINYVAKTIIGVLDNKLSIQDAISLPNIGSRNQETELEKNTSVETFATELKAKGHPILIRDMNSGTQGIEIDDKGLWGGVDPRREGVSMGQ